jgi:hypothetical protein
LDGVVGSLLLEAGHGGRRASYFSILGVEGEPLLGGEEAETQDESNQYQPTWASPDELRLIGLLPEEITQHVVLWCEEAVVRGGGPGRR